MDQIINLDDLFSPTGGRGLEKILEGLEKVNEEFTKLTKNLTKNGQIIDKQLEKTAKSASELSASTKSANETTEQGRKTLNGKTQDVEKLFNSTNKLVGAQKDLSNFEQETKKAVDQLTSSLKTQIAQFQKFKAQGNEKELQKVTKEIRVTTGQINALNSAQRKLNQTLEVANRSYDALVAENKRLVAQARRLDPQIRKERIERERLAKIIRRNTEELSRFDRSIGRNFRNVGNYASALQGLAGSFGIALGGSVLLTTGLREVVRLNAEISDSFADVRKTTGLTDQEVRQLAESLKRLNTRTSLQGLLRIAEEGGRLNVATDNLLEFTKAVDIAAVALGDDFSGGIDEVASSLGKLVGLFEETRDLQIDEGFARTGSAINELGQNTRGTSQNITDFALRIGQLPESLRPTQQDALALGAAFEEVGIDAERASRPLSIFLTRATSETAKFARQIGITEQAATDLINTDVTEFTKLFVQSLQGLSATETSRVFEELGLKADGVRKVLGALTTQVDRLSEIQAISNKAFEEGTSLAEEFAIKNNTLAGALDRVGKSLSNAFVNTGGENFVIEFLNDFSRGVDTLTDKSLPLLDRLLATSPIFGEGARARIGYNRYLRAQKEDIKQKSILTQAQAIYNQALENGITDLEIIGRTLTQNANKSEILLEIQRLQQKASEEQIEKEKELEKQREEDAAMELARQEALLEGLFELNEFRLQQAINVNRDIAEDEEKSLSERTEALRQAQTLEISLLDIQKEKALSDLQERYKDEENAIEKSYNARQLIIEQFEADLQRLNEKAAEEFAKTFAVEAISPGTPSSPFSEFIQESLTDQEADLARKLAANLARKFKEGLSDALSPEELREEIFDRITDTAINSFDEITQSRIRNIDNQIAALRNQKELELATAADNKEAQIAIEERFAQKEKELRIKRAQEEKKQALFQIAIDTAVNAVKLFAQTIPPGILSAVAVAQGAVQAALVASRPLPQFEKGTSSSPEGPAIVDERGAELIQRPDGTLEMGSNKGARMTYLEKGSKVIPHLQTKQLLKDAEINSQNSSLIDAYREGQKINERTVNEEYLASLISSQLGDRFDKSIKKMPSNETNITRRGVEKIANKGNMRQKKLDRRYR